MAVHKNCPGGSRAFDPDEIIVGTLIFAFRCINKDRGSCKGTGETPGSLSQYCEGCSEYYGICELCGAPFTVEHPKAIS